MIGEEILKVWESSWSQDERVPEQVRSEGNYIVESDVSDKRKTVGILTLIVAYFMQKYDMEEESQIFRVLSHLQVSGNSYTAIVGAEHECPLCVDLDVENKCREDETIQ